LNAVEDSAAQYESVYFVCGDQPYLWLSQIDHFDDNELQQKLEFALIYQA